MKKTSNSCFLTIILILISPFADAQNDWVLKHPLPQANKLNAIITIPGTNKIAAVGDKGVYIASADAGTSWQLWQDIDNLGSFFKDIFFLDSLTGYIAGYELAGDGIVFKTIDGGITWNNILEYDHPDSLYSSQFYKIYFFNQQVGYITGAYKVLLKTIDAGNTWFLDSITSDISFSFGAIFFPSDSVGYISGTPGMLKTLDAGNSWDSISNLGGASLFFLDDSLGYLVGPSSSIHKTIDGGINWFVQDSIIGNGNPWGNGQFRDVYFINPDTGFIIGNYERLKTENGGTTWVNQEQNVGYMQNSICFPDKQTGFIAGGGGVILKTDDVGNSWYDLVGADKYIYSIECNSSGKCFAVGSDGLLMVSDDLGETWSFDTLNTSDFLAVHFPNDSLGFISGGYNNIFRTTDEGNTWDSIVIGTNDTMYFMDIHFINDTIGFLTGLEIDTDFFGWPEYKGFILKTLNQGNTWTMVYQDAFPSFSGVGLQKIVFVSENNGFAFGSSQNLKTIDGGNTWITMPGLTPAYAYDYSFPTDSIGFVPYGFSIYQTIDAGNTWVQKNTNTSFGIYAIHFFDENIGVGVGSAGILAKTINGGDSWYLLPGTNSNGLSAIYFQNDSIGLAAGGFTTILKTTNSGGDICSYDSLIISGNTALCTGDTAVLDAGTFSSYLWSTGDSSKSIEITIAGNFWVEVQNSYGCIYFDTIVVVGDQYLFIGNDTLFCSYDSLILDAGTGFSSYQWSDSSTSQTLFLPSAGTYYVNVVDSNGCSNSDTIVVSVSTPIVDLGADATICNGCAITLDAGSGFVSYDWSNGENTQMIIVVLSDTYTVQVTDTNGCVAGDTVVVYVVSGLNELSSVENISIYPNPNTGEFVIEMNVLEMQDVEITLFNITGQVIYSENLKQLKGVYSKRIDIKDFSTGIYQLQIKTSSGEVNKKVVVE